MSWKAAILEVIDRYQSIYAQCRSLNPFPDDFFKNKKYSHLWVSHDESQALRDYCDEAVKGLFGDQSPQYRQLRRTLERQAPYNRHDLFEAYAIEMSALRTTIALMPDNISKEKEVAVTNIHIGSMLGGVVAGHDAVGNQAGSEVNIDTQAARQALRMIDDLFHGKNLEPADLVDFKKCTGELAKLASGETKDPSAVKRGIAFVADVGKKVLTSPKMIEFVVEHLTQIVR